MQTPSIALARKNGGIGPGMPDSMLANASPKKRATLNGTPCCNGRGSRIRTCGPLLPKQVLYQAELCPEPQFAQGL